MEVGALSIDGIAFIIEWSVYLVDDLVSLYQLHSIRLSHTASILKKIPKVLNALIHIEEIALDDKFQDSTMKKIQRPNQRP